MAEVLQNWGQVFIGDRNFKAEVAAVLAAKKLPRLFDPDGWNYNDPMNAALPIASIAGCSYVMRLDVDTLPHRDFEILVEEHTRMLAEGERLVVSSSYTGRYGVRCDFVAGYARSEYLNFIMEYTGIDPYHQLIAGAGLTQTVPGHPGVCFRNQMVVGIDDADFSTRLGGRAALSTPGRIYRSLPGRNFECTIVCGSPCQNGHYQIITGRGAGSGVGTKEPRIPRKVEELLGPS